MDLNNIVKVEKASTKTSDPIFGSGDFTVSKPTKAEEEPSFISQATSTISEGLSQIEAKLPEPAQIMVNLAKDLHGGVDSALRTTPTDADRQAVRDDRQRLYGQAAGLLGPIDTATDYAVDAMTLGLAPALRGLIGGRGRGYTAAQGELDPTAAGVGAIAGLPILAGALSPTGLKRSTALSSMRAPGGGHPLIGPISGSVPIFNSGAFPGAGLLTGPLNVGARGIAGAAGFVKKHPLLSFGADYMMGSPVVSSISDPLQYLLFGN